MIRQPPKSTRKVSSAASDVYKRQLPICATGLEQHWLQIKHCTQNRGINGKHSLANQKMHNSLGKSLNRHKRQWSSRWDSQTRCRKQWQTTTSSKHTDTKITSKTHNRWSNKSWVEKEMEQCTSLQTHQTIMGPVCHCASHMRTQDTLSCPEQSWFRKCTTVR